MRDGSLDCLETMLNNLLKSGDKQTLTSSKQLVDCLVENILTLEAKMAGKILFPLDQRLYCYKTDRHHVSDEGSVNTYQFALL